eukprot:10399433-Alexandrium_andersonii.AAC.1
MAGCRCARPPLGWRSSPFPALAGAAARAASAPLRRCRVRSPRWTPRLRPARGVHRSAPLPWTIGG